MSTVKKYKVAELEGRLLDAAVAISEGWVPPDNQSGMWMMPGEFSEGHIRTPGGPPFFSLDIEHGWPIIDREKISLVYSDHPSGRRGQQWSAFCGPFDHYIDEGVPVEDVIQHAPGYAEAYGPTALVAAMRAFVAAKLGEEVELP
jgi:hypothetical protein